MAKEHDGEIRTAPAIDAVEEASLESFPASDPPARTPITHTGAPAHDEDAETLPKDASPEGDVEGTLAT